MNKLLSNVPSFQFVSVGKKLNGDIFRAIAMSRNLHEVNGMTLKAYMGIRSAT